jgi:hypothetical protein
MQISNIFADVYSHTVSELDPHELYFAVILSSMHQTTNIIALEHKNFSNIIPTGQIDPLPFPCLQGPIIVHVLQLGDDCLYDQLASNPNSDPEGLWQLLSLVHVEFKGQEKARLGMAQGGLQVIRRPGHPFTPPKAPTVLPIPSAAAQHGAQNAFAAQQQHAYFAQQAAAQQAAAQQVAAQQAAAQQAAAQQAVAQQAGCSASGGSASGGSARGGSATSGGSASSSSASGSSASGGSASGGSASGGSASGGTGCS